MSQITIEFDTTRSSMSEIRPILEAALQKQFPGGMLKRKWDGDVLVLSGPGASGSITLEGGKLVGRADLKPPASMMRPVIEEKVTAAMQEAVA